MKKVGLILGIVVCVCASGAYAQSDVLGAMQSKLSYLSNRQAVISKNISNANTPGYKAEDLAPLDLNQSSGHSAPAGALMVTSPMHIQIGKGGGASRFKAIAQKDAYETAPDGNNVSLEQQMVKMSENNLDYQATLNLVRKMDGLMRIAIGDNVQ